MNKLQELVESNAELKAKIEVLNKNPKATAADFIALAKEYGVELTEADFQPPPAVGEVSDRELEAVAGGRGFCVVVGTEDKIHDTCVCILGGFGDSERAGGNCTCPVVGADE